MATHPVQASRGRELLTVLIAVALVVAPAAADERSTQGAPPPSPPKLLVGPLESVQSAASDDEVWASVEPAEPVAASAQPSGTKVEDRPLRRGGKPRPPARAQGAPDATVSHWPRTILATLGVGGLVILLGWGYRAATAGSLPGLARPRAPAALQLISRCALSPRQSVCLLRVGPRMVLVGLSPDRMTALDVITDADAVARLAADAQPAAGRPDPQFQRELEREAAAYAPPAPPAAPPERLIAARTRLLSAIERLKNEDAITPLERTPR